MKNRVGKSKWEKWQCMQQSPIVAKHLPQTEIYSLPKMKRFINTYSLVFVKPDDLSLGKNVIGIYKQGNHLIAQKEKSLKRFVTIAALDRWLKRINNNHRTLVQQGIQFAKLDRRPVDMRSIIIKNEKDKWEVTAMVAKHAGQGLAITNVAAGGTILTIEDYLSRIGYSKNEQSRFMSRFHKLSIQVGEQMGRNYRNYIYGLDIGLDNKGELWVIEANTKPDNRFLSSYNRKMYRRTEQLIHYHKEG